jgi:hypothetical protein
MIKPITVEGVDFPCLSCFGLEYGEAGEGFPFEPYRMERLMGERAEFRGYLIDAKGIIWILEVGVFERPCCRLCLEYVRQHDPSNFDKVLKNLT